ncbi:MAG TPA: hypothetical protein VEB21_06010 [Terriglobales bacterium]|nr:hypothetical protein [Terriglobales bacterium]
MIAAGNPPARLVTVRGRMWSAEWLAFVWSSVPGFALACAAASGIVPESLVLALFAISFVGLNLMHMGATWARVYVRPGWRGHSVERLIIPFALVCFALGFEALGGGALLLALQYFLSFHHALMQNYGLVRASQRRSGRQVDIRLDQAACLLLPGAALLYRAGAVCDQYAGAPVPSLPLSLLTVLGAAGAIALLAFIGREWRSHRAGAAVDPIGVGIFAGTNLIWSALLIGDPHPAIPLYALASGHYVQYLYFVWRTEQREAPAASAGGTAVRLQAMLRSSRLEYLLVLLILAGAVTLALTFASAGLRSLAEAHDLRPSGALAIQPWAAAMLGINLEHYWLDHRIWRTRTAR